MAAKIFITPEQRRRRIDLLNRSYRQQRDNLQHCLNEQLGDLDDWYGRQMTALDAISDPPERQAPQKSDDSPLDWRAWAALLMFTLIMLTIVVALARAR